MKLFMSLLISGLAIGSIYSLIAMGYSMIYKASGLMNFIQGDLLTFGAYLGLTFYRILGLPFFVSLILTILCAFLLGILLEEGVIRQLFKKNVGAIYVILATIAISYIIQNAAQLIYGGTTEYFPSIFSVSKVNIFGVSVQPEALLCLGAALVSMLALHLFMTRSKLGTGMRAASMDPMAARACGINVSMTIACTWSISTAIAALGGMLIGPMYGVYLTIGSTIGRKGFSSAVIGGYGNMYGAMVGGLLLGLIETFIAGYLSSDLKNLIAYLVLLAFLFLKPTGLFNESAIQDV